MSGMHTLQAGDVIAGYVPDLPIIHGVSAHVDAGEIVSIIGPNGAGKSTFLKAIAGLIPVSSGTVSFEGRIITNAPAHELAASGVGFVPQTGNVFVTLTIQENLVMGGAALSKAEAQDRIEDIYAMYPVLREKARDKAGVLSGGQRQILAVARALLMRPRLVLLDEPSAGLSPLAAGELFGVVRDLAEKGTAVLMVEQNAKAALRISDRGYVLAEGQNRIEGPGKELLSDEKIGEIFLGVQREASRAKAESQT